MSIYTTLKAATAILLALSAQGTLAAAVLDASAEGLVPRIDEAVQLRVEYCDKINFKGRCNIQRVGRGKCANIKASFNDETTAIRNLDTTLGSCTWFIDTHCRGDSYDNQDDANLTDGNGEFAHSISSMRC